MSIPFFTPSNMAEFWSYARMLLEMISPGVMLVTGTAAVGIMLPIIIKAFKRSDKDLEKDERDFEYQEY